MEKVIHRNVCSENSAVNKSWVRRMHCRGGARNARFPLPLLCASVAESVQRPKEEPPFRAAPCKTITLETRYAATGASLALVLALAARFLRFK